MIDMIEGNSNNNSNSNNNQPAATMTLATPTSTSKVKVFPGIDAFTLHDSLGFPIDLTVILAGERGYSVDIVGYECEMQKQRKASVGMGSVSSRNSSSSSNGEVSNNTNSSNSGNGASSNASSVSGLNMNMNMSTPLRFKLNGYDMANLDANHVQGTNDSYKYTHTDSSFVSNLQAVVLPMSRKCMGTRSGMGTGTGTGSQEGYEILFPGSGEPFSRLVSELSGLLGGFESGTGTESGSESVSEAIGSNSVCIGLILDNSIFYAEAGGQVGDSGSITVSTPGPMGHTVNCRVYDVQEYSGYILHMCTVNKEELVNLNDIAKDWYMYSINMSVDVDRRHLIATNHSTTHILNHTLRSVLNSTTSTSDSSTNPSAKSNANPKPKPNLDTTALVIVLRIDNDGKYCGKA